MRAGRNGRLTSRKLRSTFEFVLFAPLVRFPFSPSFLRTDNSSRSDPTSSPLCTPKKELETARNGRSALLPSAPRSVLLFAISPAT